MERLKVFLGGLLIAVTCIALIEIPRAVLIQKFSNPKPRKELILEEATNSIADATAQTYPSSPSPEVVYTPLGTWTITAYCGCEICCGEYSDGFTASGTIPRADHTVACNTLPFGTLLLINGKLYEVEDTGSLEHEANWIDIYFNTHDEALDFGVKELEVYLAEIK